ncbi:MAG TPA: iron ABC transporter permease [Cyclobacteriaceae bacterium]|nr:iron ABC transporter permease [Cyclobacteriaceae bacterium]
MSKKNGYNFRWMWLLIALFALFFLRLLLGSVPLAVPDVIDALLGNHNAASDLVFKFRLPVAVTCILAGSSLAVGGLLMQTLFRNALAGPDVLGLTSGSSLMVAVFIMAGNSVSSAFANPWTIAIAASVGAAGVFLLILVISQYVRDNTSLLIIGLMLGATTASIVGVLQYVSRAEDLQAFMIWGLGSVGSTNWDEILVLTLIVLVGICLSLVMMKPLNALLLGENYAVALGINVKRSRLLILTATSIMTGGVTAFCGPVAFVGLAVPHLVRIVIPTTNHKTLLPAVCLGGAILLLLCDIIAQLPGSTQVLPLNAVTSMLGAPVVIWLVIRNRKVNI